jgi:MFS family permease
MLNSVTSTPRLLALSGMGGALEFFDFIIFLFLASEISANFFPPETPAWLGDVQTLGIFAAGYVFRPLGGLVMAHFGDQYGRKRVFLFSILLMAFSTFGIALVPNYEQIGWLAPVSLLVLRSMQGAAIGGEAPGAWTFIAEHVPAQKLAFACAFMSSSMIAGLLLASLVTIAAHSAFTPADMLDYGWRVPFAVAGLLGLVGAIFRHWLRETPVFLRALSERKRTEGLPVATVMRNHRPALCISLAATWTLSAVVVVTTLMTPFILQRQYGFEARDALALTAFGAPFLCVGGVFGGLMSERLGIGKYLMLASLPFAAANLLVYHDLAPDNGNTYIFFALASFFNGLVGVNPCLMVRAFPSNVRFTGISLAYNVAFAVSGGLTPVAMGFLLPKEPMAHIYYLFLIAIGIAALGALVTSNPDLIRHGQGRDEEPQAECSGN